MFALPTEGARHYAASTMAQVPGLRGAEFDFRIGALQELKAKREKILAHLDRIRQQREAEKAAREQRRKQYMQSGMAVGGALLGGVTGGLGAGLAAGGMTALQGATLGGAMGTQIGSGLGGLAGGDPMAARNLSLGLDYYLENQPTQINPQLDPTPEPYIGYYRRR